MSGDAIGLSIVGGAVAFAQAVLMIMLHDIQAKLRDFDARLDEIEGNLGIPHSPKRPRRDRGRRIPLERDET